MVRGINTSNGPILLDDHQAIEKTNSLWKEFFSGWQKEAIDPLPETSRKGIRVEATNKLVSGSTVW